MHGLEPTSRVKEVIFNVKNNPPLLLNLLSVKKSVRNAFLQSHLDDLSGL